MKEMREFSTGPDAFFYVAPGQICGRNCFVFKTDFQSSSEISFVHDCRGGRSSGEPWNKTASDWFQ